MSKKQNGTTSPDINLDALDIEATSAPVKDEEIVISADDVKEVSKVNYPKLKKMLEAGEVLVAVTNDSDQPLIQDWNLDLLPTDIEADFNKYIQDKYVQYEINNLVANHRIVSVYMDGKTINFLDGFLAEKRYPQLLPRAKGKEAELRPSFVINSGSSIIMTRRQADALSKFEKVKRTWVGAKGEKRETPWLGFLKMKTLKDVKDLFKYSISYVTSEDIKNTHEEIREGKTVYTRRQAGIIREEE